MKNLKILICLALITITGSITLTADMASGAMLEKLTLEDLLNVPIVTASAVKEKPSDSPTNAYVISGETIRDRGYSNLLDLLEDVPQIQIARNSESGHGNTVSMQGMNGVERFQIMIDGVRVTPVTGNLYAMGRQFSLRNARQVEIILGPMSALYGADVFSGVINIVTRSGYEMPHDHLDLGFADNSTHDLSIAAGAVINQGEHSGRFLQDEAAVAFTAHQFRSRGAFMPKYYPDEYAWYNNEFQAGRVLNGPGAAESVVAFQPWRADEEADFMHFRLNLENLEIGVIRMTESHSSSTGVRPEFTLYYKDAIFKTHYNTVYGRHTHKAANGRWQLQSQISHHFYELDPQSRFFNNFSGYQAAYKYARDESTAIEERLSYNLRDDRLLMLGVTWQEHSSLPRTADLAWPFDPDRSAGEQGYIYPGSDLSTIEPQGIPQEFYKTRYTNLGGYAQLHLNRDSATQYIFGARYDKNSLYGSSFNPRVGIVHRPGDKTNIKLMYGTAFLAPPTDKSYAHFGAFAADPDVPGDIKSYYMNIANPDLKPEKISSLQSEFTYSFTDNLRATISAYDSHIFDMQRGGIVIGAGTFKGKPVDTLAHWSNLGEARAYGGTARLDAVKNYENFTLSYYGAFTYSNGDIAGEPLPYSAKHSIKAGLTFKNRRFTVSPRVIYQGRSYNQLKDAQGNRLSSDPFIVANLYLQYRCCRHENMTRAIFINITNLTDQRYYHPGFAEGGVGFSAAPQAPRLITGGMTFEF